MEKTKPKFCIGQMVHHKLYDYYGVILSVDPNFQSTEDWYETMTRKYAPHQKPPKDKPWYHVQVHNGGGQRYVCERNLELDSKSMN